MTLPPQLARPIRAMGQRFDAEVARATRALCIEAFEPDAIAGLSVQRDLAYGPDVRHRLDIYNAPADGVAGPCVLFVHGGAFVAGDKTSGDGAPFYENVGLWAARHGCIAIAMTYRLAPAHTYPAGAEDIAAAIGWIHRAGPAHGIDPASLIVMGQSAGAVHVATYLARRDLHLVAGGGVRAGMLLSGLYDMTTAADNPPKFAYFGRDPAFHAACSSLGGLIASCDLPLLVGVCEFDPVDFQTQALALVQGLFTRDRRWPQVVFMSGHNHLSSIFLLGSPSDTVGPALGDFVHQIIAE